MKTLFRISILLAVFTIFFISACEPVDEDNPDGDPRDAYIGEWQFVESFKSTKGQSYVVDISKDPDNSSQIILENFGNSGVSGVYATAIVTSDQIVIPNQEMSNGWVTEGSGQMSNQKKTSMNLSYYFIIGADKENYTTTATKL